MGCGNSTPEVDEEPNDERIQNEQNNILNKPKQIEENKKEEKINNYSSSKDKEDELYNKSKNQINNEREQKTKNISEKENNQNISKSKRKEEEKRIRKEKLEKIEKEIELNKNNKEKKIKIEIERINRETQEKEKIIKEKSQKFIEEYEKKLKEEEEKRIAEDEKEGRWEKYEKIGGEYHSKKEIRQKLLPLLKYSNTNIEFEINPQYISPYNSGKISEEYLKIPFKMLNMARYMVGIDDNVINEPEYEKLAQDASLLMKVNNKMAHTGQPKPQDMTQELYDSGAKGCKSCNLFMGLDNLYKGVEGWLIDNGNFTTIGHRRWILHPPMKKTGFGFVKGFAGMYCFDNSFGESKYKNIPWPCRYMTLEFANTSHWTLSTGKILSDDIEVTLTNIRTKKIEKFSNKDPNKFHISNENYGLKGCIIFEGPHVNQEELYRVDIEGKDLAISYDVEFFNVICKHEKVLLETIESSCVIEGKNYFCCKKCGEIVEEEIEKKKHNEIFLDEINPTCLEEGKKVFKCDFCCEIIEKKLDIIPHNYEYKLISKSTGETHAICKYCEKKIIFMAPTEYSVFWGKVKYGSSYSSECPSNYKVNSTLYVWITYINGDKEYKDFIVELSDNELAEITEPDNNIRDLILKRTGQLGIIIYPKYNPELKNEYNILIE